MYIYIGLGTCSGLKTSGYGACHKCGPTMKGRHSKHLSKIVYHEHRTHLPMDDPERLNVNHWGATELRPKPIGPTPSEYDAKWKEVERKVITPTDAGISRWSILYSLEYWEVCANSTSHTYIYVIYSHY